MKNSFFPSEHFLPYLLGRIEEGSDYSNDFQWCKQYDPLHQLRCNFIISFQLIAQSLTCQYDPMYNIYLSTLFVPKNPWLVERGNQYIIIVQYNGTLDLAFMVPWAKTCLIMPSEQLSRFLHLTQTSAPRIQSYVTLVSHACPTIILGSTDTVLDWLSSGGFQL